MKKEKSESPVKTARKKAKDSVESRLTKTLKSITAELGQEAIDIEKTAKKLAKKLTKGLKGGKKSRSCQNSRSGKACNKSSSSESKTSSKASHRCRQKAGSQS